jgi:DNA-binding beta-propeller fold protein YncE
LLAVELLEDRFCPSGSYLFVSSFDTDSVLRYSEATGAYVDTVVSARSGGLRTPMGVLFGHDQNLYVSSGCFADQGGKGGSHADVLQYDGTTGSFLSDFADSNQLTSPRGMIFGPDGNLYVADGYFAATIVRYNGTTGAFIDDFVPTGSGGLSHTVGLVFGPDGAADGKLDLYVCAADSSSIFRYDGTTGAFKGVFVPSGSGGLTTPQGLAFGPDGNLYVASGNFFAGTPFPPGSILRYEGPAGPNPGTFLGTFIPAGSGGLSTPGGLLFGPDGKNDGKLDLYVASAVISNGSNERVDFVAAPGSSEVLRYDGTTGAFIDTFVSPDSGGLQYPTFMTFTETDPATLNYDGGDQPSASNRLLALAVLPAVRQSASALDLASLATSLLKTGPAAVPPAPAPGPAGPSTPPASPKSVQTDYGTSSPAHVWATDALFAVSRPAANDEGDVLLAPLVFGNIDAI